MQNSDQVAIEEIKKLMGGHTPDAYFYGEKEVPLTAVWFFFGPLVTVILRRIFRKFYVVAYRGDSILVLIANKKFDKFDDIHQKIHKSEITEAKGWKHGKFHNFRIKLREGNSLKFRALKDELGNIDKFEKFLNIDHTPPTRDKNAQKPWQGVALSYLIAVAGILIIGRLFYYYNWGMRPTVGTYISSGSQILAGAFLFFVARKVFLGKLWSVNVAITLSIVGLVGLGTAISEGSDSDALLKVFVALNAFIVYLGISCARDSYYRFTKKSTSS